MENNIRQKACERCGKAFQRPNRIANHQWESIRFCGKECRASHRRESAFVPDESVLREMYLSRRMTAYQIADQYGVHRVTAVRWLKHYEITVRPANNGLLHRGITPPTKEELIRMVHEEHRSYEEIASLFGVDFTAVPYWLKKHGIKKPKTWDTIRKDVILLPDKATLLPMVEQGKRLKDIGKLYGVSGWKISQLCTRYGIPKRTSGFNGGVRYLCEDGLSVRSVYEQKVADWLHSHGVAYLYEPHLPFDRRSRSDFSANGWSIEIWGVEGSEGYLARKNRKLRLYALHSVPLIELEPHHFYSQQFEKRMRRCLSPAAVQGLLNAFREDSIDLPSALD